MNLKLSSLFLFLLFFISCVQEEHEKKYIDGDDLIPPRPPFWEYFTVHGFDVDQDGVRDDLELWINKEFPNSNIRRAMKQEVRTYIKLINSKSREEAHALNLKLIESEECLRFVTKYLKSPLGTYDFIERINNNFWRGSLATKGLNLIPKGEFYSFHFDTARWHDKCEFEIENKMQILDIYIENERSKSNKRMQEKLNKIKESLQ